jgi:hypothetical protein
MGLLVGLYSLMYSQRALREPNKKEPVLELYTVIRKSGDTAEAEPVVLRSTETTRLVFKPLLVNNAQDAEAPVKGTFIFQKKGKSQNWEDFSTVPLSNLKSGEGVKLELHAGEFHELLKHAGALYRLYRKQGLPKERTHFIKLTADQDDMPHLGQLDVGRLLKVMKRAGSDAVSGVLEWISHLDNAGEVVEHLARLEVDSLKQINSLVGATNLRALLQLWEENQTNSSEEFWQRTLQRYAFILSHLFAHPVVLFKDKAYVGGKGLDNTGGHIVDFLFTNQLTRNAVLVEIKTPKTPLLGRQYRGGGVYGASDELAGAVTQVLTYRHSLTQEILGLASKTQGKVQAFSPQCMILIGNGARELDDPEKARSFELFRGALGANVVVLTFDEVISKAKALLQIMEGSE